MKKKVLLVKQLLADGKISKEEALILLSTSSASIIQYIVGAGFLIGGQFAPKGLVSGLGFSIDNTNLMIILGSVFVGYPIIKKLYYMVSNKKNLNEPDFTDSNIKAVNTDIPQA